MKTFYYLVENIFTFRFTFQKSESKCNRENKLKAGDAVKILMTYNGGNFLVKTSFDMRHVPKDAKFFWDSTAKLWYTKDLGKAARLREYADAKAEHELSKAFLVYAPWSGSVPYPKDLVPYEYQNKAAQWALERNRSYVAADPGLGKTIIAALIFNALNSEDNTALVYICPPFLVPNTEIELTKWSTVRGTNVQRYKTHAKTQSDILIVPDSLIIRAELKKEIKDFVAFKNSIGIRCILVIDEAHRFKNLNAKRTKALFNDIAKGFDKIIHMSGTPMPSRPFELFPVLYHHAPALIGFRNMYEYGIYFCAAFQGVFGWDFSGVSNFNELIEPVRLKYKPGIDISSVEHQSKFMLRISKADVLTQLPEKTESLVLIDDKLPKQLLALQKSLLAQMRPEDMTTVIGDTHLSTYRKELGLLKAKSAAKFIKEVLEDSGEAVIVFALHKDAIASLALALKKFNPLIIVGDVDKDERARRAIEFQENPARKLIILNIAAGGVGFNLQKASRVIFVEFDWVPGNNEQAADRAHRIGQRNNVFVQYLIFKDSLDALVLDVVMNKRRVTKQV